MDIQKNTKKYGMAALLGVLIIGVILISGSIGGGPSEEDSNETRSGPGSAPYNQLCHYDQSLNKCVGICQAIMGPSECEQPVCIMTNVANKICECVSVVENCSPNCSCMSPAGAFNQGYELCPMQKSILDTSCGSHETNACELLSGGYGLCYKDLECVPVEICPEGCTCLSPEDACNESLCNNTEILCEVDGGHGFCFEECNWTDCGIINAVSPYPVNGDGSQTAITFDECNGDGYTLYGLSDLSAVNDGTTLLSTYGTYEENCKYAKYCLIEEDGKKIIRQWGTVTECEGCCTDCCEIDLSFSGSPCSDCGGNGPPSICPEEILTYQYVLINGGTDTIDYAFSNSNPPGQITFQPPSGSVPGGESETIIVYYQMPGNYDEPCNQPNYNFSHILEITIITADGPVNCTPIESSVFVNCHNCPPITCCNDIEGLFSNADMEMQDVNENWVPINTVLPFSDADQYTTWNIHFGNLDNQLHDNCGAEWVYGNSVWNNPGSWPTSHPYEYYRLNFTIPDGECYNVAFTASVDDAARFRLEPPIGLGVITEFFTANVVGNYLNFPAYYEQTNGGMECCLQPGNYTLYIDNWDTGSVRYGLIFAAKCNECNCTSCNCSGELGDMNVSWMDPSGNPQSWIGQCNGHVPGTVSILPETFITVDSDIICDPASIPPVYSWEVTGSPAYPPSDYSHPATFEPLQTGSYKVTLNSECCGNDCPSCAVKMNVELPQSPNCCEGWDDANNDGISDVTVEDTVVNFDGTITVTTAGLPVTIEPGYQCQNNSDCLPVTYKWHVDGPGGFIASSTGSVPAPIELTQLDLGGGSGNYVVTLKSYCDDQACEKFRFNLFMSGPQPQNCTCEGWNDVEVTWIDTSGSSQSWVGSCGDMVDVPGHVVIPSGTSIEIDSSIICEPSPCQSIYEWEVTEVGPGPYQSESGSTLPVSFTPAVTSGWSTFEVMLNATCGGIECSPCTLYMRVNTESEDQPCTSAGCECFLTGEDAADLGYTEFCNESCTLDGTAAWCWKKPECPDCIISYWQLDETAGTTVMDSNNGNDGTLVSGPIWTPGIVDGALQFDGGNSVNIPHNSNLNFATAPFALEAWIKYEGPTDGSVEFPTIMSKRPAGTNPNGGFFLGLSYWSGATPGSLIMRMDNINYVPGTTSVDDGNWHHIVVQRCANNSLQFWIDGALDVTETSNKNINSNADLRFGFDSSSSYSTAWEGALDEVAVYYKCCLSANEIAEHYQSGLNHEGYC